MSFEALSMVNIVSLALDSGMWYWLYYTKHITLSNIMTNIYNSTPVFAWGPFGIVDISHYRNVTILRHIKLYRKKSCTEWNMLQRVIIIGNFKISSYNRNFKNMVFNTTNSLDIPTMSSETEAETTCRVS
jgi:hypothetical protein